MRNTFIIIISILLIIITILIIGVSVNSKKKIVQKQANNEYEQYLDKDFYGADVITIINKAVNNNNIYNVKKDTNGNYIENDETSIIIDIVMIVNEEKEKTKSYRMERINKVGINEFIKNFNTAKFGITQMEYHKKSGKIKYIQITEKK